MTSHAGESGQRRARWTTGRRRELARRWAAEMSGTAYVPMSRQELERYLLGLVDTVAEALDGTGDPDASGRLVGTRLVEAHFSGAEGLRRSLELLGADLLPGEETGRPGGVLRLLAAIAAGYSEAVRETIFRQQESMKSVLLKSKLRADLELQASEERFREVFETTPIGVAITDTDGRFVGINSALADIFGYTVDELNRMTPQDLVHADDVDQLVAGYTRLAEGRAHRLRERLRLLRADGTEVWSYLAISVLRETGGAARHFVTMVEDVSELKALQERFRHQALHDLVTGLPNQQFFMTRLESALANFARDTIFTLYQLDINGLDVINDGMGHETSDGVLRMVARRLGQLTEAEEAMVARVGDTEFAILLEQSPGSPGIAEFAARINEELSEPVYLGRHGIATSASIGVVQRRVRDIDPVEMVQDAEVTLRRARAAGPRQWALFDPESAARERARARISAVMPGALELGEFEIVYQPLVLLGDGRTVGVEAQVRWEPDEHEPLGHPECTALAARSGVALPLRDWLLHTACEQVASWHRDGHPVRLVLELSEHQAQDPDLVAVVRTALAGTGLPHEWLRLCVPMSAVLDPGGEAADNVTVLDGMGVQTALQDFRAGPAELRRLRDLPARTVRLADELVRLALAEDAAEAPEIRGLSSLVPLIRDCGAPVAVGGIETGKQAEWWHSIGCAIGQGPYFGALRGADEVLV